MTLICQQEVLFCKEVNLGGKAYNHETRVTYEPATGYEWQALTGSDNLKWEIVATE